MGASTAIAKADSEALAMIANLPDQAAKVASRGNATRGVVSKAVAQRLLDEGKVRVITGGRITTNLDAADQGDGEDQPAQEPPKKTAAELFDEREAKTKQIKAENKAKTAGTKVNGRKAAADKLPYSSSKPNGHTKRHGKSRRTGTETAIVDLLHKDGPKVAAKFMGETEPMPLVGAGRFAVICVTHKRAKCVPDMTEAKPLQARTDQFDKQCAKVVAEKDAATK